MTDPDFWPCKNDDPFKLNNCYHGIYDAVIKTDWLPICEGYKKAADILSKYVFENQHNQDFLIYPIAFLYRHHIELKLKEIMVVSSKIMDEPFELKHHHKLIDLWHDALKRIKKKWPNADYSVFQDTEDILNRISKFDPGSFSFRYPLDKKQKPNLEDGSRINILNLSDVFNNISAFLDSVESQFKLEWEFEYEQRNYRDDDNR